MARIAVARTVVLVVYTVRTTDDEPAWYEGAVDDYEHDGTYYSDGTAILQRRYSDGTTVRTVVLEVVDGALVPCGLLVLAEVHAQALPQKAKPG